MLPVAVHWGCTIAACPPLSRAPPPSVLLTAVACTVLCTSAASLCRLFLAKHAAAVTNTAVRPAPCPWCCWGDLTIVYYSVGCCSSAPIPACLWRLLWSPTVPHVWGQYPAVAAASHHRHRAGVQSLKIWVSQVAEFHRTG